MTAPSKVSELAACCASVAARAHKPRKFPVSDGAPVEVVEDGPSLAGRLMALAAMLTIKPTLAIGSYAPRLPWPFGLLDFVSACCGPHPGTVRATIGLPNCSAQLVRAPGVLPADGKRRVVALHARRRVPDLRSELAQPARRRRCRSSPTARCWSSTTG